MIDNIFHDKLINNFYFIILLILSSFGTSFANSDYFHCQSHLGNFPAIDAAASKKYRIIHVPIANRTALKRILNQFNLRENSLNFRTIIKAMEHQLRNSHNISQAQRADRMAAFAEDFQELLKGLETNEITQINFYLAESVISLERFGFEEYIPVERMSYDDEHVNHRYIHLADYRIWVESYIDRTPPHTAGHYEKMLLTTQQMRDLASHNLYPILLKLHDSRHIHYAFGHQRGVAAYFLAARSKNHMRYGLMACLYEGVDRPEYQYDHEKLITSYFRNRGMNMEEALLYLGRCKQKELERIVHDLGVGEAFDKYFLGEWTPSYVKGSLSAGERPRYLDLEVALFIKQQDQFRENPNHARYLNFQMDLPKDPTAPPEPDDPEIH